MKRHRSVREQLRDLGQRYYLEIEHKKKRKRRLHRMDFIQAMDIIKQGGSVTRETWGTPHTYVQMYKGQLCLRKDEDKQFHPWIISEADIYAHDWVNCEELGVGKA